MSKSPVTRSALAAFAAAVTPAAFAAAAFISILSQNAIAQETPARQPAAALQRLPVQLVPGIGQPEQPTRKPLLKTRQAEPTRPGGYANGTLKGGPGRPSQLANLVVIPYYNNPNGLPEGFPTHSYCLQKPAGGTPDQIRFWVRNAGGTDSGSFQWTPSFPTAGAAPATVIANVPAGGQVLVTQGIPTGCYTPGFSGMCQFSIHLDDHNEVPESSEANTYASYCVSPAG
jgi:hypothetical protein